MSVVNVQLKSETSRERVFVRFKNVTGDRVDVIWVDYGGVYISYATLEHNQYIDVNTYTTHPWLFLNSETQGRMHVNGTDVFYGAERGQRRQPFTIQWPLYSLRQYCIFILSTYLNRIEHIRLLELPIQLKYELDSTYKQLIDDRKRLFRN